MVATRLSGVESHTEHLSSAQQLVGKQITTATSTRRSSAAGCSSTACPVESSKGTAAEALASGCGQGTRSPRGRSLWSQLSSTSPARGTSWGSRTGPRQACNGVPPGCSRAPPSTSTQRGRARVPPQARERVGVRRGHSCHALESFGVNHGALLQRATAPAEAVLNCDEHTMTSRQDALVVSPAHHVSEATAAALLA